MTRVLQLYGGPSTRRARAKFLHEAWTDGYSVYLCRERDAIGKHSVAVGVLAGQNVIDELSKLGLELLQMVVLRETAVRFVMDGEVEPGVDTNALLSLF